MDWILGLAVMCASCSSSSRASATSYVLLICCHLEATLMAGDVSLECSFDTVTEVLIWWPNLSVVDKLFPWIMSVIASMSWSRLVSPVLDAFRDYKSLFIWEIYLFLRARSISLVIGCYSIFKTLSSDGRFVIFKSCFYLFNACLRMTLFTESY